MRPRSTKRGAAIGLALVGTLHVTEAQAQDPEAADKLFQQGRAAMARGDHDAACKLFEESDQKDRAVGTKLNLAACEEKRGRYATALRLFQIAKSQLASGDTRLPVAKRRIAALEPKVSFVTFSLAKGAPADTTVRFGSVELESDAVGRPYPMEAGAHRILVDAHGRSQSTYDIELKAGEQQSLEVSPGKPTEGPEATAPVDGRRTRGYVLAGVGAAGVSVGLLAGALVLSKKSTADDHCDDSLRICDQIGKDANDSGRTWATVSTVGWLVGAAGLGAGAYFLLKSDPGSETAAAVRIDPRATSFSMLHRW